MQIEEPISPVRGRCLDCAQCQMCSRSRCRLCRKGDPVAASPQPGIGLTHGAYLEWKRERDAQLSGSEE